MSGEESTPISENGGAVERDTIAWIFQEIHDGRRLLLKEGWLTKQGGSIKSQSLETDEATLHYFETQADNQQPKGVVNLEAEGTVSMKSIPGKRHTFQIVLKDRTWVMYSDSFQETDAWVQAVSRALKDLPIVGDGGEQCERCQKQPVACKVTLKKENNKVVRACKECSVELLAAQEQEEQKSSMCDVCKFRFKSDELLRRHTADWHTCMECASVGKTVSAPLPSGDTRRACEKCAERLRQEFEAAAAADGGAGAESPAPAAETDDAAGQSDSKKKSKKSSKKEGKSGKSSKKGKKKEK